jgi:hypothetical protein
MDYTTLFDGAADELTTALPIVAVAAVAVGGTVLAVKRGWRWFRGLSNG